MTRAQKKTAAGLHQRPKSREETPKEGIGDDKVVACGHHACALHKKQVGLTHFWNSAAPCRNLDARFVEMQGFSSIEKAVPQALAPPCGLLYVSPGGQSGEGKHDGCRRFRTIR